MDALDLDHVMRRSSLDLAFCADVLEGLSSPQRAIPARWLYDHRGSRLFECITHLPEYYPTRTEIAILGRHMPEIAALTGTGREVVEFGSGSSLKTPLLLSAIEPSAYVPIDISGEFLGESIEELSRQFPTVAMFPMVADFTQALELPASAGARRLGFFPGSTIGNMIAPTAVDLLRSMAQTLGPGAQLLIGIDRIKREEVLIPAYADAQGVTAQFNLNLLHRINRELQGNIPVDAFDHEARWNDAEARIEMHLRAARHVEFSVMDTSFRMEAGDSIHTENSIKYGPRDARLLLRSGGWTPVGEWVDEHHMFAVLLAEATVERMAP
jgi:L-histidine N-alpha-methyltransferase